MEYYFGVLLVFTVLAFAFGVLWGVWFQCVVQYKRIIKLKKGFDRGNNYDGGEVLILIDETFPKVEGVK